MGTELSFSLFFSLRNVGPGLGVKFLPFPEIVKEILQVGIPEQFPADL